MKPLISIIIPTYQRRDKLKIALMSIMSQTYRDYEVLIMDDGSTDGTDEMVYSFKDSRIFYNWHKNSGSPANPRNKGIKLAKGDWIAFLDSDDSWSPDKLKICMDYCNNQVDLIYHDLEIKSNKQKFFGRKIVKSRQLKKPILIDLMVNGNAISNSSVVVRKSLLENIGGIDEQQKLKAVEDYHTWLRIAQQSNRFFYIKKKLGYYLLHDQNISHMDMSIPLRHCISDFIKFLNDHQKLKVENNFKYISGRFNYLNSNFKKAKQELLFVLKEGSLKLKVKALIMIIYILICADS